MLRQFMKWKIAGLTTLLLMLVFFVTDCSTGKQGMEETIVNDRIFIPSRDYFTTQIDTEGNVTIEHNRKPEEWRLLFSNGMDLNVEKTTYLSVKPGDHCFIAYRIGRWTKVQYLKKVRLDLDPKGPVEH